MTSNMIGIICSADEFIEYLISFCGAVGSEVSE